MYGICAFIFQITLFKYVVQKIGLRKTYMFGNVFQIIQTFMLPMIAMFISQIKTGSSESDATTVQSVTWLLLFLFSVCSGVAFMCALPSVQTMLTFATDQSKQGLVQGTTESLATLLRAIGPTIAGILFSIFSSKYQMPFVVFTINGAVYLSSILVCWQLSSKVEGQNQEESNPDMVVPQSLSSIVVSAQNDKKDDHDEQIEIELTNKPTTTNASV